MITFAPFPETETIPLQRPRLNWLPLLLVTTAAVALTTSLPGWARMWLIAIALFAGFKWWTWRKVSENTPTMIRKPSVVAVAGPATGSPANANPNATAITNAPRAQRARATAFLLLWPGMNARAFLATHGAEDRIARTTCCPGSRGVIPREQEVAPKTSAWLWALGKTLLGLTLLFLIARHFGHGLTAGWIAMIGFIFTLHFGLFHLLSLFWQSHGIDAPPLMKTPIAATSLHDFWGRRWNAGFRDIVFVLFFFPLARRYGTRAAALATFVLSGLIHELVITVPAGGGYGLPTLYFALQGLGLMSERKLSVAALVRAWNFRPSSHGITTTQTIQNSALPVAAPVRAWTEARKNSRLTTAATTHWPRRLRTLAAVTLPIGILFPPIFVLRVMVPFFQLIHAL